MSRSILAAALGILVLAPAAAALVPEPRLPDGHTAYLSILNADAGYVLEDDYLVVQVAVFEKDGESWSQVRKGSVLRAAAYDLGGEQDVVSMPFTSSATERVTLFIPRTTFELDMVDLWVTIHHADSSVSTSHYGLAKNVAIENGQYDLADALDYHHVVNPVSVG